MRGLDVGKFFLKEPEAKIGTVQFNKLKHYHVKHEDIFITVVGTIGKVAIITDENIKAIFSCKSTILRSKINPYYLTTFFNTKIGHKLLVRGKRGAIQEGLNLTDLKEIKIPIVSDDFQMKIEKIVKISLKKLKNSEMLYKHAEEILLEELDLSDFKPSQENIAIKTFSESFGISGRLDGEYYQPKYEDILEKIKKIDYDKLINLVNINKSIEPGSDVYQDAGIPFVRVSNLTKNGISNPDIHLPKNLFVSNQLEKLQPKKNTILLSKDGTIGIAYNIKDETNIVTSGAILHLTIKREDVLPEYLTLVLNSLLVKMQSERDAGGSIIKHWKPSEIAEILIPILENPIQIQIEEKIKESFVLKEKSQHLLEISKKAVEIAIEKDEEKAVEYINRQI
ncbi:restriction endonuclease subunit S [Psychrilyobacter sp.]|uniref:restriction endonuclease subunit S n=1 Tax=Psychrilyobacter sp. TaxID=2586924 RepID=UPI003C74A5C8